LPLGAGTEGARRGDPRVDIHGRREQGHLSCPPALISGAKESPVQSSMDDGQDSWKTKGGPRNIVHSLLLKAKRMQHRTNFARLGRETLAPRAGAFAPAGCLLSRAVRGWSWV
ncbi:unnamed protein product, partial [Ectocarpus sp. 12 AP-2014]